MNFAHWMGRLRCSWKFLETMTLHHQKHSNSTMCWHCSRADTRRLVFSVPLCRWFERQTFQFLTGISDFYVTRWVTNTARSWISSLNPALVVSDNSWWRYFFLNLSDLIADRGPWYFQVCQSHSALWTPQKPFQLRVLALTSEKQFSFAVYYYSIIVVHLTLYHQKHSNSTMCL